MRIAQVVPLWEQIQSLAYSGAKLLAGWFVGKDEFVGRGHNVTLLTTRGSLTLFGSGITHLPTLWLDSPSQGLVQDLGIARYSNHETQHLRDIFVAMICSIVNPEGVDFFEQEMKPCREVMFHSMANCRQ
jgi:hypothetical protein